MPNLWLFDGVDAARESFLQKILKRNMMPEYKGDSASIQVYLEKYLPKLQMMHNRIQSVIRSVQHKDTENPLWRAVEYIPFQPTPCHVGVFEVIAINMQDPPRDVLQLYGGECREGYRRMTLEIRQKLWPVICKIVAPYESEVQLIHEDVEVECFDDKLDSVFGVFLKFRPKEIDKQGQFKPGLESQNPYKKGNEANMNDWMFDGVGPAIDSLGTTDLLFEGIAPAEEALFTPSQVRKNALMEIRKLALLPTKEIAMMYITESAKAFPQYRTTDEDFEREKEAFMKAAAICCEGFWEDVEIFSVDSMHGVIASTKGSSHLRYGNNPNASQVTMCLYINSDVKLRWSDAEFAYMAIANRMKAPLLARNLGKTKPLADEWIPPCDLGQPCDVNIYL